MAFLAWLVRKTNHLTSFMKDQCNPKKYYKRKIVDSSKKSRNDERQLIVIQDALADPRIRHVATKLVGFNVNSNLIASYALTYIMKLVLRAKSTIKSKSELPSNK